jgi:hypothetical protein
LELLVLQAVNTASTVRPTTHTIVRFVFGAIANLAQKSYRIFEEGF